MGCGGSRDGTDRSVQREIERDKIIETRVHKLLLLGAGGSGKSTFFKQLKTIHGDGHTPREKDGFKRQVYGQVIESMQILVRQCKLLTDGPSEDMENDERAVNMRNEMTEEEIADYKIDVEFAGSCKSLLDLPNGAAGMDEILADHVTRLWNDCPAIIRMFEHRNKICVPDSSGYFFKQMDRIGKSDYVPNNDDILFVRYRTTGMTEKEFRINEAIFKVHDVGGQRNERKKWIHFFDGVTAVLFVVSLTCYDEVPFEDVTDLDADVTLANSMLESIKVFEETLNTRCFQRTGFILFFNKSDLMQEKIKRIPITTAFPEYRGQQQYKPAVEYIQNYFLELNKVKEREMFGHITTATDTKNVEKVFNDVQQCVVNWSLRMAGLV